MNRRLLFSISVAILLALTGAYLLPHHHAHSHLGVDPQCSACVFHQEHGLSTAVLSAPGPASTPAFSLPLVRARVVHSAFRGHTTAPRGPPPLS